MYTANEHFGEAVNALVTADQGSTGGANKAAICTEMETQRAISAAPRLPLSAGLRAPKRLTRRRQGGGTPAGRLAQTGQRSPIEVVSGGVLDGWVVSSERESIGIV